MTQAERYRHDPVVRADTSAGPPIGSMTASDPDAKAEVAPTYRPSTSSI